MNVFEQLGLREELVKAVSDLGFENPTPIQEKAIPMLLDGNTDLVGLAQTGTGKTAAFGLPMLHKIDFSDKSTQALVVCPTRELCLQITKDLTAFAKYFRGANIVAIYGGASIEMQAKQIHRGAQIVVATPGRLIDMISRRKVNISAVKVVVLDEADEMLNMGFKEDIDDILSNVPKDRSTWLFSATMPREVAAISKNYMTSPKEITVGTQNSSADNIEHQFFMVREKDRYFALKRVIDFYPEIYGIIFCRTRRETQEVAEKLIKDGYNCESLHGDLSQGQRDMVMKKFRERTLQLLCATDVAARGIDVSDITHVINYNLPDDVENYTHRSGRTARAGKSGLSMVFVNTREGNRIRDVERQIKKKFTQREIPSGKDICEKQLFSLISSMVNVNVNEKAIEPFLPRIEEALADLTKEEIVKRFVSAEFNRFLDYYKTNIDLNVNSDNRKEKGERSERGERTDRREDDGNFQRLFFNVGEMDNVNKGMLVRLICDSAGIPGASIGRIDIKREFSFVDVGKEFADQVVTAMSGTQLDRSDRTIRVEISEGSGGGSSRGGDREGGGGGKRYGGGGGGGYKKSSSYGGGSGGGNKYGKRSSSGGGKDFERKSYDKKSSGNGDSNRSNNNGGSGENKRSGGNRKSSFMRSES